MVDSGVPAVRYQYNVTDLSCWFRVSRIFSDQLFPLSFGSESHFFRGVKCLVLRLYRSDPTLNNSTCTENSFSLGSEMLVLYQ